MFDLIIRGGKVYEGTENPWFVADVGIAGGRIAAIGRLDGAVAGRVIAAAGLAVCPGFIDVHVHSELALLDGSEGGAGVLQGVTTQVLAPDGMSYAPLPRARLLEMRDFLAGAHGKPDIGWDFETAGEYLAKFAGRLPHNVLYQAPHSAIRLAVVGWEPRPATDDEIRRMQALTRQTMDDGAAAFATILDTAPCCWSDTRELIALSQAAGESGGFFAPHIRYPIGLFPAVDEALEVAERARVGLHMAHYYGEPGMYAPVEAARERGIDVTFDAYPYWAGSTTMLAALPQWARAGAPVDVKARLAEPATRRRLRDEATDDWWARPAMVSAVQPASNQWMEGKIVGEIAAGLGVDLVEWACDLLIESDLQVTLVSLGSVGEEAMLATITHPLHMTCTDGLFLGSHPHPRGYNTYPRLLGHYVRERGILTWQAAIRKCTSFPAQRYRLSDRGLLRAGLAADLVVFDPATIIDRGWFSDGKTPPAGIRHIVVNGELAVEEGRRTPAFAGQVLKPHM